MRYKTCTEYWLDPERRAFRGEFEAMYRDIDDPWGCQAGACSKNNRRFADLLFADRRYARVLDLGCGLGAFTVYLRERNGGGAFIGCDVSATAVCKASAACPEITFYCRDVLRESLDGLGRFDLVILSEILWYILADLPGVFAGVARILAPGGVVGVHQYFPTEQRFGRDVVDGLDGFLAFVRRATPFVVTRKDVVAVPDGAVLLAICGREADAVQGGAPDGEGRSCRCP